MRYINENSYNLLTRFTEGSQRTEYLYQGEWVEGCYTNVYVEAMENYPNTYHELTEKEVFLLCL